MNNIGRIKLRHLAISIVFVLGCFTLRGQTLEEAKELYLEGRYAEALPIFQIEYRSKPNDASLNHWLGVCLYETGNIRDAEKHLAYASQKKIPEAYIYLGELYTKMYRFDEAEKEFEKYRKIKRRDKEALARLEEKQAYADRLKRLVKRTEDIQIIDSIAVAKNKFLSAYRLSASSGSLVPMNEFFSDYPNSTLPVFINEKKDKIYFSQQDPERGLEICSMEKLLDNFGNRKILPPPVNDEKDQAYPFVMTDGVTLYFASTGHNSLGGYDLYVTRYNLSSDSYLNPNQMNMPFNSPFNDYMMVIDEEKNVGWFATDRFLPKDSVCVYTFIPNREVTLIESDDEHYLAKRARISSIKDTWKPGVDYAPLIALAKEKQALPEKEEGKGDFEFIIDDHHTYHKLSDFKSPTAGELFAKALTLQETLDRYQAELAAKREQYAESNAADKNKLADAILSLEKDTEALYKEIQQLTLQARNEEIRNMSR